MLYWVFDACDAAYRNPVLASALYTQPPGTTLLRLAKLLGLASTAAQTLIRRKLVLQAIERDELPTARCILSFFCLHSYSFLCSSFLLLASAMLDDLYRYTSSFSSAVPAIASEGAMKAAAKEGAAAAAAAAAAAVAADRSDADLDRLPAAVETRLSAPRAWQLAALIASRTSATDAANLEVRMKWCARALMEVGARADARREDSVEQVCCARPLRARSSSRLTSFQYSRLAESVSARAACAQHARTPRTH